MKKRQFIMLLLLIAYYGSNAQKFKPLNIMVGYKGIVYLSDFTPYSNRPYTFINGISGDIFLGKRFAIGAEYSFGKSKVTTNGTATKFNQGAITARLLSPVLFQNRVFLNFVQSVAHQRKTIEDPTNVSIQLRAINTTFSMGFLFRPIEFLSFELNFFNVGYTYGNSLHTYNGGTVNTKYNELTYLPLKIGANYIFSIKNNQ
jgi:hypothetical protein